MIPHAVTSTESVVYDEWIGEVDNLITREIIECYPRSWSEDFISYKWLLALRERFHRVTISDLELPFTISWDAYKAEGAVETRYGDIGVIVNFYLRADSAVVTGVGFLEAKRVGAKGNYPHMEWEQLKRESSNIAGHRVLLYDFESIDEAALNLQTYGFCSHLNPIPYSSVHAAVAITQHVLAVQDRSRSIGALGVPLGYQLCARYLRGLDLDYNVDRDKIFDNIPGGPGYLIVANVEGSGNTIKRNPQPLPLGYGPLVQEYPRTRVRDGEIATVPIEEDSTNGALDLWKLKEQFQQSPLLRRGPGMVDDEEEANGEVASI